MSQSWKQKSRNADLSRLQKISKYRKDSLFCHVSGDAIRLMLWKRRRKVYLLNGGIGFLHLLELIKRYGFAMRKKCFRFSNSDLYSNLGIRSRFYDSTVCILLFKLDYNRVTNCSNWSQPVLARS